MDRDFRRSLFGCRVAATDRLLVQVTDELEKRRAEREAQLAALHQELERHLQDIRSIEQAIHQQEQAQSSLRSTLTMLAEGVRRVQNAQARMTQEDAQRMAILARRESMLSRTERLMEEFRSGVLELIEKTVAALSTPAQDLSVSSEFNRTVGDQPAPIEPSAPGAAAQAE